MMSQLKGRTQWNKLSAVECLLAHQMVQIGFSLVFLKQEDSVGTVHSLRSLRLQHWSQGKVLYYQHASGLCAYATSHILQLNQVGHES